MDVLTNKEELPSKDWAKVTWPKASDLLGRHLIPEERSLLFYLGFQGRNRFLPLFSIQGIQFVLPQYLLIFILKNKSSSFLFCGNPKNVIYTYTQGEEAKNSGRKHEEPK